MPNYKLYSLSQLKVFFKDTAIYGMGAVLPKVINFALIGLITATFGAIQFDGQTQWFIFAGIINVILTLGLETAFFRFFTKETKKEDVVSTSFIMLLLTTFSLALIAMIFTNYIALLLDFQDSDFLKILILVTILDTWVVIPFALLRVTGRPIKFLWVKLLNIFTFALIVILFLYLLPNYGHILIPFKPGFKPDIIHLFYANLAASFITFAVLFGDILKMGWHWNGAIAKKLFQYGWPIMIGGLAYMINENFDKILLSRWVSKNDSGIYAACYKLSVFITLYVTAFRMGAEPFFFSHSESKDATQKYSMIMTWFVLLGCLFIVGIVSFLDLIAPIFLRQAEFLEGLYIVPILLIANLFAGIYNNLAIWYKLTDRTKFGMFISILGAVITIASLIMFIPLLGIVGGAWATLLTYFTMTIISYLLGRRYYPVPYEVNKIFGFIIVASIISFISFNYFRGEYVVSLILVSISILWAYYVQVRTNKTLKF